MNRKKLMISALIYTALLTIVFVPTFSQQLEPVYDPWTDYDGNGIIDIIDVIPVGVAFGSSGNSRKT